MNSCLVKLILVLNLITLSGIMGLTHLISTNVENGSSVVSPAVCSINSIQGTDTISVDGDPDFKSKANTNGWDLGGTRDGSASLPFLITGNTIISDTGTLISIRHTTYHFELKTNAIKGGTYGIYLWNVTNGKIYDNIISDCSVTAIYMRECPGPLLISDNTITNITEQGIYVMSSNKTVVSTNTVTANGTGIYLYGSNTGGECINNSVSNNRIVDNLGGGIFLYGANNNTVESNELINTGGEGIYLVEQYPSPPPLRPRIHNNTIKNNTIKNAKGDGIYIEYSMKNSFINNTVFNSAGSGIELYGSRNDRLIGNNFTDSNNRYGIYLHSTNETTMIDNVLENNNLYLYGGSASYQYLFFQGEVHGNLVDGKPLVFWQNVNGGMVPTDASQVFIVNSTNIEIANLNLYDVPNSIVVAASSHLYIHNNSIYDPILGSALKIVNLTDSVISSNVIHDISGSGIDIEIGKDLVISDNLIYNCRGDSSSAGIDLENVDDSSVADNTVQDSSANGILLQSSFNNTINRNNFSILTLTTPWIYGMRLYLSDDNWVVNNTFYNFTENGILLLNSADNNSFLANTIKNSTSYGIYITSANDNTIKFNSLIDNNQGSVQAYDNGLANFFEHNYWNDMSGPDGPPSDGFVDTNYTVDGGLKNNDTSALTAPYTVTPPAFISPNGGEILKENISVQWTAASDTLGYSFTYDLYYSTSDEMNWVSLATGLDELSFEWDSFLFPNSPFYLLKVVARNSEGFFAEDVSDGVFTIQNIAHTLSSPVISYPLGGDTISGIVNIQWTAVTDSWNHYFQITYVIYYSADGGTSWTQLGSLGSTSFLWGTNTVSDGSNYKFKVVASNTEGLTSEFITNPAITIQNHVLSDPTIIAPNGGEVLSGTYNIHWTAVTDSKSHSITYTVYYSSNGGTSWIALASGLTETSLQWTTTTIPEGSNYLIRVVATCSQGLTAEDSSDSTFAVQNGYATSTSTTTSSAPTTSTGTSVSTEIESSQGWTGITILLIIGALGLIRRKRLLEK